MRVGITGSSGLIGAALARALRQRGSAVIGLDVCAVDTWRGDILDEAAVADFVAQCDGVVHAAGVSRVIFGERDPDNCLRTNILGTKNVLDAACRAPRRAPWVIYASSREVYGEPESLPVGEDAPVRPCNVYGQSKAQAESLALAARHEGLATAVLRFSNVYGSVDDHRDRVVPAFCRAAAAGEELRLDGAEHTFDFTHVDDTVRGILATIDRVAAGTLLPPIHLLTGRATTLRQLAKIAIGAGKPSARFRLAPSRTYDVARFVGDPSRAATVLNWRATTPIEEGVVRLVRDFAAEL